MNFFQICLGWGLKINGVVERGHEVLNIIYEKFFRPSPAVILYDHSLIITRHEKVLVLRTASMKSMLL